METRSLIFTAGILVTMLSLVLNVGTLAQVNQATDIPFSSRLNLGKQPLPDSVSNHPTIILMKECSRWSSLRVAPSLGPRAGYSIYSLNWKIRPRQIPRFHNLGSSIYLEKNI